jgi:hypothetical protein
MESEGVPSNNSVPSDTELKNAMLNYALLYLQRGLSVIPLIYGDKKPAVRWEEFQVRRATEDEVKKWFSNVRNIGIVCGSVSGKLVVLDIESEELFQKFYEKLDKEHPELRDIVLNTWLIKTGKGRHIYLRVRASDEEYSMRVVSDKHENFFEVRSKEMYVVAPPSLHPSGKRYEFTNAGGINDPIAEVDIQALGKIVAVLHEVAGFRKCSSLLVLLGVEEWKEKSEYVEGEVKKPSKLKKLSDKDVDEIIKIIKPYYASGHRQNLCLHLAGCMARLGVHPESVAKIIYQLQKDAIEKGESKDPIEQRLSTISYTYQKLGVWNDNIRNELEQLYQQLGVDVRNTYTWRDIGEREFVTGCQRLQEAIEAVSEEQGLTDNEAVAKAFEAVMKIKRIAGALLIGGRPWMRVRGNKVDMWGAAGRYGLYVIRLSGFEKVIERVSEAVISSVRRVEFYLVDADEEYYRVCFKVGNGKEDCRVLSKSEIPHYIRRRFGLKFNTDFATHMIISWLAEEEPMRLYYSPGIWVNDEHVVLVTESGYNPDWKPRVEFEVFSNINDEYVRNALMCIKKLVESYKNPKKASLVLSYAVVAPLHHYLVRVLRIGFHMMIRGERQTGKTLLIDLLRLLYMLSDYDEDPRTDYQIRVLLSKTTMPALIPECIRACTEEKLLQIWKASATSDRIAFSGGAYRGLFLAIRPIIAATNERIEIPTDLIDKVIVVEIDSDEGVDLGACRGCTPRTMKPEVREGVRMLGMKIIQKLNSKIEDIKKLQNLDRVEILRGLIRIGYDIWTELYKEYGLEPFISPFLDDGLLVTEEEQFAEEERSRFSELVEEFIKWYAGEVEKDVRSVCAVQNTDDKREYCEYMSKLIDMFRGSPENQYTCYWEKNMRVCSEGDATVFERFGLIRIVDASEGKQYVVMTKATFNRFIKFLKREYRMLDRDVERVRSSLAIKLTTVLFRTSSGDGVAKKLVYKIALS